MIEPMGLCRHPDRARWKMFRRSTSGPGPCSARSAASISPEAILAANGRDSPWYRRDEIRRGYVRGTMGNPLIC